MTKLLEGTISRFKHGRTLLMHIPRTGGRWTEKALHVLGDLAVRWDHRSDWWLPVDHVLIPHYRHDQLTDVRTFITFIRHPVPFYESVWKWLRARNDESRAALGRLGRWHPKLIALENFDLDFNVWLERMVTRHPAWVTQTYNYYTGPPEGEFCDYIGRTETLEEDFVEAMSLIGYENLVKQKRQAIARIGKINTFQKKATVQWSSDLRNEVERLEVGIIDRFYSPTTIRRRRYRYLDPHNSQGLQKRRYSDVQQYLAAKSK